jgi:DNA invertase Pin-like site-specific DNA recombinase
MEGNFVAYYRVSTAKQGQSGLGLQAQKEAVAQYLNGGNWKLLAEFTEVETGKGSNALSKRPELQKAISCAKKAKATLIIAKLDRLSRNVHFISSLMESKIDFLCCDMPSATPLTIHIMSAIAEDEAKRISERTKAALAQTKKNGVQLGNPQISDTLNRPRIEKANSFAEGLRSLLSGFKANGMSQRAMLEELKKLGIPTARGGLWSLKQLQRVLGRLGM